jgi:Family of unknown function (DUF6585)
MTDTLIPEDIIDSTDNAQDEALFIEDDLLGRYISHHPVNRLRLVSQAGLAYFIATTLLQLLFIELDDRTASILLVFFFSAIALGLGWYVMHLWNREVVVYEHGFNFREGSSIADFQYDEVMSFRQKAERLRYFGGLFRRNVYTFTVRTHRDEVIKLTNLYTDIEKLGNNLEVGINSALHKKIRQALASGESVSFGESFEISDVGMTVDEQDLSWDEFESFGTKQGRLTLSSMTDEAWYQISLEDVDNLSLLVKILREKLPKSTAKS